MAKTNTEFGSSLTSREMIRPASALAIVGKYCEKDADSNMSLDIPLFNTRSSELVTWSARVRFPLMTN